MVTVLTEVYEILRKQFGDEDAKRLMDFFQQNLVRLATKDDVAQLEQKVMTELVGKADKVDLARIRELLEYKTDKEDAARIEAELRSKADKEDVAQVREAVLRLEARMNLQFVVLLLVIIATNPRVWELLGRILPFMK